MLRRRLEGVKAALLATLILGGGGLPLLDVVLHFESSGTRHGHGDYCKAGSQLPHSPEAGPLELDRSVDSPTACVAGLPADAAARRTPVSSPVPEHRPYTWRSPLICRSVRLHIGAGAAPGDASTGDRVGCGSRSATICRPGR